MTDKQIFMWLMRLSRFLDHRDTCEAKLHPDYVFDHRSPEACSCGLNKLRKRIRREIADRP